MNPIELLREENTKLHGWLLAEAQAGGRLQRKLNTAEDEIERLRSDIREMATTIEGQVGVILGLQTEIERLRERIQAAAKLNMELMELRDNNEEEIERLRKELNRTRDAVDIVANAKNAEIERLRALLRQIAEELGRENKGLADMVREALGE